jgi:glyoxylase-like metal-dependent hydrolase (beta-lactamase superfamily II)
MRLGILLVTLLYAGQTQVSPMGAQSLHPILASAVNARKILDGAIDAIGGAALLASISDITRKIERTRADPGQEATPGTISRTHGSVISIRDFKGQRLVEDRQLEISGGQIAHFATLLSPTNGYTINYQTGFYRTLAPAALSGTRAPLLRRDPETLFQSAVARAQTLRLVGTETVGNGPQDVITFSDVDGELVTLFIDHRTHLLTKTEFVLDDPVLGDLVAETVYSQYTEDPSGLKLPRHLLELVGGDTLQVSDVTRIAINTAPGDTTFAPPKSIPIAENVPSYGVPLRLDDGVFVIPGPYASMFVIFRDYIVAIEGGGDVRTTENAVRQIKALTPGKPIRYVVATHHHSDHLAGLRTYIAEGATIVTTEDARPIVARMASSVHSVRPDALSHSPRQAVIETVTSKRVFTDGVQAIEVYQVGPNAHVRQMLTAYLPKSKILFEADMVDLVDGHPAPGGEDTGDFAKKIAALGLEISRIVPVHGVPGTIEDLRTAVARIPAGRAAREDRPAVYSPQPSADEIAIRRVLEEWLDALRRADTAALQRIIPEDYSITVEDGRVLNRDQDLAPIKSGRLRFQSMKTDSVRVRIFGDAAVVTGIGSYSAIVGTKMSAFRERFTDVYVKRGGKWQPVASHSTPLHG